MSHTRRGLGAAVVLAALAAPAGAQDLNGAAVLAHPALGQVCREVAVRAFHHYDEADLVMRRQPRRAVRAPRLMEAAYRSVLQRTMTRGFASPRKRIGTRKLALLVALLRHAFL